MREALAKGSETVARACSSPKKSRGPGAGVTVARWTLPASVHQG